MNKFLLAIPALCDFITSTLQYVALNFIPGSIYQMMRGGTIITTFIFSVFFLKTKVQKYQILGCLLAFLGVFVVGVSNMVFRGGDTSDSSAVILFLIIEFTDCRIYPDSNFPVFQWLLLRLLAKIIE